MTQPLANILLRIEQLLNAGKLQEARMLLVDFLQQNPASARGWWLLSLTLTDVNRQVACLQRGPSAGPGKQASTGQAEHVDQPDPRFPFGKPFYIVVHG